MTVQLPEEQTPAYRRIYERVRVAIVDGRLRPGDQLPSTRALAEELGVARGTVDVAYALLAGEGYVEGRGRRGTIVSRSIALHAFPERTDRLAAGTSWKPQADPTALAPTSLLPLTPGLPALDAFPRKLWSQLVARRVRAAGAAELQYPEALGDSALRSALSGYLSVARGIRCAPEQIVITGGYQSALGLILRGLLPAGGPVWTEVPGYEPTRRALEWLGAEVINVPVDPLGLDVEAGLRLAEHASLCVVAPAHQFPLGVSLALSRRLALLDWARRREGWIIEDDYDGEFHYDARTLPALKSLDEEERVFYVGTFSKTLFPGLRLGYIVVPSSQIERLHVSMKLLEGGRPSLEQGVTAEFITSGHFARHIRRMRLIYAARRHALATALIATFGAGSHVERAAGGLHLILRHHAWRDDKDLAMRARRHGLGVMSLSAHCVNARCGQGLIVGFANSPETQAVELSRRLLAATS